MAPEESIGLGLFSENLSHQQHQQPRRILCLHDAQSNTLRLKRLLTRLGDRLYEQHGRMDLVYINSPLTMEDSSDRLWWYPSTDGNDPHKSIHHFPSHDNSSSPTPSKTPVVGLDASLLLLRQIWTSTPFWGILGVGQGAALAALFTIHLLEDQMPHHDILSRPKSVIVPPRLIVLIQEEEIPVVFPSLLGHTNDTTKKTTGRDDQNNARNAQPYGLVSPDHGQQIHDETSQKDGVEHHQANRCNIHDTHDTNNEANFGDCHHGTRTNAVDKPDMDFGSVEASSQKREWLYNDLFPILHVALQGHDFPLLRLFPGSTQHVDRLWGKDLMNVIGRFMVRHQQLDERNHRNRNPPRYQHPDKNDDSTDVDNDALQLPRSEQSTLLTNNVSELQTALWHAEQQANQLLARHCAVNPPNCLRAMILPPSIMAGWQGPSPNQNIPLRGAPCPAEFRLPIQQRIDHTLPTRGMGQKTYQLRGRTLDPTCPCPVTFFLCHFGSRVEINKIDGF